MTKKNIHEIVTNIANKEFAEERSDSGWRKIDHTQFSTDKFTCLKAFIQDKPGELHYGHMVMYLIYGKRIFKLEWRIHVPHMMCPHMANRPVKLREYMQMECGKGKRPIFISTSTRFGENAWLINWSDSDLDEESRHLKDLFRKIKAWSVENQMCRKIRKNDNLHLKLCRQKSEALRP